MECMVQDGSTPLLLAVRGHHDTIVKALVAAGADASGPLYDACLRGDTPIVKVLLAAPGVNPNVAQAVRGAGCVFGVGWSSTVGLVLMYWRGWRLRVCLGPQLECSG